MHINNYNKNYYNILLKKHGNSIYSAGYKNKKQFLSRKKPVLKLLSQITNSIILDIGCSCGFIGQEFNKNNVVYGIDNNFKSIKYAHKKGLKAIQADASSLPFLSNKFTAVICIDVSQEIKEIDDFIKEIMRVTKKNSQIIISFLNCTIFRQIFNFFSKDKLLLKSYKFKKVKLKFKKYNLSIKDIIYNFYPLPFVKITKKESIFYNFISSSFVFSIKKL